MRHCLPSSLLFSPSPRTGGRAPARIGKLICCFILALFSVAPVISAQQPITVADMQVWNQIADEQISPDGRYLLYRLEKDVGDPTAVLYDTQTKQEHRFPRLHQASLSFDGKSMIGRLKPALATVKALRLKEPKKAKDKLADMDSLLVWNFADARPAIIPQVYDFKMPARAGDRYAYTTKSALPDSLQKGFEKGVHRLLVRTFSNQDSFYLEGVKSFVFARDNSRLLAHQTAKDSSWDAGVLLLTPENIAWQSLSSDQGDYAGLTLSNDGQQAAFMTADADKKDPQKAWHLHYWSPPAAASRWITEEAATWLPAGYRISEERAPRFSEAGDYLFFGTTPRRPERDTNLLDEEIADVEVWTTEDDRMYTEENVRLKTEEKRTYLAVYRPAKDDFLQLGTEARPYEVQPGDLAGHYVMVYDDRPYAKATMWEGGPGARNTTVIDLRTGERKAMLDGEVTPARWLDGGKFLVWYNAADTTWNSFAAGSGEARVLTTNATGIFYDELNDRPMHPSPYGLAGTLQGGEKFLVYDRYDVWELDPTGQVAARRITRGRESGTEIRLRDLDPLQRYLDPAAPQLVVTQREADYHGGIGWLDLRSGKLTTQQSGPYTYGNFLKARNTGAYVYSRSDFREFPDLRYTKDLSAAAGKISTANPQQADFSWGTNELYEWVDHQGRTLRGMLIKPDGFDPAKKYPLLVNFYERSSDRVFRHNTPVPGRSSINYSHYVSKGYVIFNPDVIYREGYPGESAYDCVMSGVLSLLSHGYVDKDRIGLQGHSWGGYQAAYLVTKTDLFTAVEAGAPVVNMFSAYGGIRWGSGRSRQFQYEHTQSRIGGTPWTHFQRYVENSPLFTTDKINTPLLILHNDHDGAVPWYQGIEWFTALRRLGKPAWLLNYRGEPHWPLKPANRADFQTRMAQFFDYYLMGEAKPRWMDDGVKPIERAKGLKVD